MITTLEILLLLLLYYDQNRLPYGSIFNLWSSDGLLLVQRLLPATLEQEWHLSLLLLRQKLNCPFLRQKGSPRARSLCS